MNLAYPWQFDSRGHTATTGDDEHIRDLIEQVLFTSPGERVNRPTFGSGVLQLVSGPNGDALAAAAQLSIQCALQHCLGDDTQVEGLQVRHEYSTLRIVTQYSIRRRPQPH